MSAGQRKTTPPDKLRAAKKEWEAKHAAELAGERKKQFVTEDGIALKTVYTPLDLEEKGIDYTKDLSLPGEFPYTRGITATMYRGKLPDMMEYSGRATPEESNALWRKQLGEGASTVCMAFDLPTQLGYDPDNPRVQGEVGKTGAPISSLRDFEVAFNGIDVGKVEVYAVCNAPAIIMVSMHLVMAQQQGIDLKKIKGVIQNDILKEYIARGNYIFSPGPSVRIATDLIAYLARNVPNYRCDMACNHMRARGATPVQETAWALSNAIAYFEYGKKRGVPIDDLAAAMSFLCNAYHTDFLEEIAKLRAMRKSWARILSERYNAKDPKSMKVRMWLGLEGSRLLKQQPLNNIARTTLGILAAALAGAQSIDGRPYDEVYGIPSAEALSTALRSQQVVLYETRVGEVVDPLAGSYYLEWLTKEFEERIFKEIEAIDKMGGMVRAIELGYPQRVMSKNAYQYIKQIEAGEVVQVGVNAFTAPDPREKEIRPYRAKPGLEQERIAKVQELRRTRDNTKVKQSLASLEKAARSDVNLVPSVMEAVKAYATLGEICDVFRGVFGEYRPTLGV